MALGDTTNRIAGSAILAIDGKSYLLEGAFAYSPVSVTRETVTGQDHVHGYKEMPKAAGMSMSIRDAGGLTVADFNGMTNVTIVAELANGKTVSGSGMWQIGEIKVDTTDGKFDVEFECRDGAVTEL